METKTHYPLIRTIYLYIFALLGLVLLIVGSVRFLDMALRAFVFTAAEKEERLWSKQPPFPPIEIAKIGRVEGEKLSPKEEVNLSNEEKAIIDNWIIQYNNWREERAKIDPVTSRRHREASLNLAFILIGLPLYLYHWSIIRRETKKQ